MTQALSPPLPAPLAVASVSPYRGLEPYEEADWPFFFGRDQECDIVTANLMASRLTLLYGASGVGKTSVLRAGVSHHLTELTRQQRDDFGKPEQAVVVFSTWRDEPVSALVARTAAAVAAALADPSAAEPPPTNQLADALQALSARLGGQLLIILDQFEEYFLYHAQASGPGSFLVEFPQAINRSGLRANFLISIREDALAKLDHFKARLPTLFTNYLRLEYLDRECARSAIEQPIEHYNSLHVSAGAPIIVEPALTEEVLNQVGSDTDSVADGIPGGAGSSASALIDSSYLQVVMTRLWSEEQVAGSTILRLETLRQLGNARDILRTHLDETMRQLPPDLQDAAAEIFHYLVTPSGSKIAHAAADLANYTGIDATVVEAVLRRLSEPQGGRLLRSIPPFGHQREPRYEIRHDRLAEPVLSWRTRHLLLKADKARSATEQKLTRELMETRELVERERDLAVTRTRRRFLLPALWTGLYWLVFLGGTMVASLIAGIASLVGPMNTEMLGVLALVLGALLYLLPPLVVARVVHRRAHRLRRRQVYATALWWFLGSIVGALAGAMVVWVPFRGFVAFQFWLQDHNLPTPPLMTFDNALSLVVLATAGVVIGLVVQGTIAGRLTLREVDRAGGFDVRDSRTEISYAGFWLRAVAACIDGIFMLLILTILQRATGSSWTYWLVSTCCGWFYYALSESSVWQATPGKKVVGLRVTNEAMQRITFRRATLRHFAKLLSYLLLYVGVLMVPFTERKQGLHDKIAGTLVLRDRPFWLKPQETGSWIQAPQQLTT
jgi:uncharacterized RDD family membrane protein YckC